MKSVFFIRFCSVSAFLLVFFSLHPIVLAEEKILPEQVKIETPQYAYEKGSYEPALGEYSYIASWQGIPAARAKVSVVKKKKRYYVTVDVKTVKLVDLFYKLRYHAEAVLVAKDFKPRRAIYNKRENSHRRNISLRYSENEGVIVKRSEKKGKKEKFFLKTNNLTLDPIALAFLARGMDWDSSETKVFDSYEGKNRYIVSLESVGKRDIALKGKNYHVWEIVPSVVKVASNKKNKLNHASIYLTTDKARDIVLIKSSVFIGDVTVKLESFNKTQ